VNGDGSGVCVHVNGEGGVCADEGVCVCVNLCVWGGGVCVTTLSCS
jgi:hypothetical protein